MILIDMDMPTSCKECPFIDDYLKWCALMPRVGAWLKESEECTDRRASHCPIIEHKKGEENMKNEPITCEDYSVTWNEVKILVEKNLKEKRGKSGDDKIPMGVIRFALDDVWNELYAKMKAEYGREV